MNSITKKNAALAYYAWLIRAVAHPQTFEEWLDWLFIYFSRVSSSTLCEFEPNSRTPARIHPS